MKSIPKLFLLILVQGFLATCLTTCLVLHSKCYLFIFFSALNWWKQVGMNHKWIRVWDGNGYPEWQMMLIAAEEDVKNWTAAAREEECE